MKTEQSKQLDLGNLQNFITAFQAATISEKEFKESMVVCSHVSTPVPGGVVMSKTLQEKLRSIKVEEEVIEALKISMLHMTSEMSVSGWTYANAMERAFHEWGYTGIKMQVMYMLLYLKQWQGEEARQAKKILNKWIK
jgi:hypothetical protein